MARDDFATYRSINHCFGTRIYSNGLRWFRLRTCSTRRDFYEWNCSGYHAIASLDVVQTTLSDPNRDEIKQKALESKTKLSELILNKIITVELMGTEKYGRLLGNVYTSYMYSKININKYMVDNNYAYEYFGGTKKTNQI